MEKTTTILPESGPAETLPEAEQQAPAPAPKAKTKRAKAAKPVPVTLSEAMAAQQEAVDSQNAEVPSPPPTPTLNPDDPNAKVVETPLAELPSVEPPVPGPHFVEPPPPAPPAVATAAPAQDPAQVRCFKKVQYSLPFFVGGKAVKFEAIGGNLGVIRLNEAVEKDVELITALDAAAEAKKGGVVQITELDYEDLKKNHPWTPLKRGSQPALRVWDSKPRSLSRPAAKGNAASSNGTGAAVAPPSADSSSRGPTASAGEAAGAGKSPAVFAPAMKHLSERKSPSPTPVLRPPSTGKFRPDVPTV